jgi:beta-phosphoglucomutase
MITDVAKIHGRSEDGIEAILAEKDRLYALGQRDLRPVPGAIEAGCCHLCNLPKSQMRPCVSRMTSLFEVAIDSSFIVHPKPSPEVFEKAIAQMEMAPSDCWIIEDALNGFAAAREVPCFTVALTTSFGESDLLRAGADVVVR